MQKLYSTMLRMEESMLGILLFIYNLFPINTHALGKISNNNSPCHSYLISQHRYQFHCQFVYYSLARYM